MMPEPTGSMQQLLARKQFPYCRPIFRRRWHKNLISALPIARSHIALEAESTMRQLLTARIRQIPLNSLLLFKLILLQGRWWLCC